MRILALIAAGLGACLAACASTPPVSLTYFTPRADLQVAAAISVGCDTANQLIPSAAVTTHSVTYSADFTRPHSLDLGQLDGPLSNPEFGFTWTGDGRLQSVNATQTGQGQAIAVEALKLVALAASAAPDPQPTACALLRQRGKDGVLTMRFQATERFDPAAPAEFSPASQGDQEIYDQIRTLIGDLCINSAADATVTAPPVQATRERSRDVLLALRQPRSVAIEVSTASAGNCGDASYRTPVWRALAMVPQLGQDYHVPIPRSAPFGQQVFSLVLAESGAIQTLKYGRQSGAAGALTAATAAVGQFDDPTPAEETARLRSEADVIAAQQRLIRCQTQPTCT